MSKSVAIVLRKVAFAVVAVIWILCMHLMMCIWEFGEKGLPLQLIGRTLVWNTGTKQTLGFAALGAFLVLVLIGVVVHDYRATIQMMVVLLVISLIANYLLCSIILVDHGVGTIRASMETELWQEDLSLKGELGVYGGYFETTDGRTSAYYICDEVDVYGPFSYQVIHDWGELSLVDGDEFFASCEVDGLDILKSVTLREYDDGLWVISKEFVSAEDVRVEIEHIEDLRKYALQAKYTLHRGGLDSRSVMSEMSSELEDLLK